MGILLVRQREQTGWLNQKIPKGELSPLTKYVVTGGHRLYGEIEISGAKNAVVAILPATILAQDVCRIENIPDISDVSMMVKILSQLGADVKMINRSTLEIDTRNINSFIVPNEMTKHLRASYYMLGALLGRFSMAKVSMPGGCWFGVRPIDLHLRGFELLGGKVSIDNAMVSVTADRLIGSAIYMDTVSVGDLRHNVIGLRKHIFKKSFEILFFLPISLYLVFNKGFYIVESTYVRQFHNHSSRLLNLMSLYPF